MWNTISTNKLLEQRIKFNEHQKHRNTLSCVKTTLNNKQPYCPSFIKSKSKQKQIKQEQLQDLYKNNQILLTKMLQIERNPSKKLNADILYGEYRSGHVAPESIQRANFLRKVQEENDYIYQRMSTVQSNYSQKNWEKHKNKDIYMSSKISQNARRGVLVDYTNARSFSKSLTNFYDSRYSATRKSLTEIRSNHDLSESRNSNQMSYQKNQRPMTQSGSKTSFTNLDRMQFL
ncbi:hypothetical protein ABPG74_011956 [Tetrahymena malaccensis]